MLSQNKKNFAELFKKYRLLSQFNTLAALSKSLQDEGFSYDPSILSHWQNGKREPSSRELIITIIRIFITQGGITNLSGADEIIESLGLGRLTEDEITHLFPEKELSPILQIPRNIAYYTERVNCTILPKSKIPGKIISLYGISGSGKTTLAIEFAQQYKQLFPDGVIWIQYDTSTINEALNHIGMSLEKKVTDVKNIHLKAAILRSYICKKKLLIILDNVQDFQNINLLFPNNEESTVLITSNRNALNTIKNLIAVYVGPFTTAETKTFFTDLLGAAFYNQNSLVLLQIAKEVGFLPIILQLIARQLANSLYTPKELLKYYQDKSPSLTSYQYQGKNLAKALSLSINNISLSALELLKKISILSTNEFSLHIVNTLNIHDDTEFKNLMSELSENSLVQVTSAERYKLHPLIALYCQHEFPIDLESIQKVAQYYSKYIALDKVMQPTLSSEVNILLHILKLCIKQNLYDDALNLWKTFSLFLWNTGRWEILDEYGESIISISKKLEDTSSTALLLIRERSWFYYWRGNREIAKEKAEEGLRLAKKLKNNYLIAFAKQRLAVFLLDQNELKLAKIYLQESFKEFKATSQFSHLADGYIYFGHLYNHENDKPRALQQYTNALKIAKKIGDIKAEAISNSYLGNIYIEMNNYVLAKEHYEHAYTCNLQVGSKVGIALYYLAMAKIKYQQEDFSQCMIYLTKARNLSEQLELKDSLTEIESLESNLPHL
jgi:tetratricopeptide (TPR) repeat protein